MNKNIAIIVVLIVLIVSAGISAGVYYFKKKNKDTPLPVVSTPLPVVSTPSPVVSTSPPVVSTPSPIVSTPPPVVSTSPPVVSTSPPVVSTPSPVVSTPSPVVSTKSTTIIKPTAKPIIKPTSSLSSTPSPIETQTSSTPSPIPTPSLIQTPSVTPTPSLIQTPSPIIDQPSIPKVTPPDKTQICSTLNKTFCSDPVNFMNTCMQDTNDIIDNSPYIISNKITNCRNNNFDILDKTSYDKVRDKLISLRPELGDPKNKNYLPSFPSVDCSKLEDFNNFCVKPDKYIDSCMSLTSNDKTSISSLTSELIDCRNNHFSLLNKDSYEKARDIIIGLKPELDDSSKPNYLRTFPTADCLTIDEPSSFCKTPDKYIDSCMQTQNDSVKNSPVDITVKLKSCIKDTFSLLDEQSYNTARISLSIVKPEIKDPTSQWYLPPYIKGVDCGKYKDPEVFCKDPNNYIDTCSVFEGQNSELTFSLQLRDCFKNHNNIIDKSSYEKARQQFIEKNSKYNEPKSQFYLPPYSTIECSQQNSPDFCKTPNSYLTSCQGITGLDDISYASNLQKCVQTNNSSIDKDEYEKARESLIKNDPRYDDSNYQWYLPPYSPLDCQTENSNDAFCQNPLEFFNKCRIINKTNVLSYILRLKGCLTTELVKYIKEDEYNTLKSSIYKIEPLSLDPTSTYFLPPYPKVNCSNIEVTLTKDFCSFPDDYITSCEPLIDKTKDPLKTMFEPTMKKCVSDKYDINNKDRYNKARDIIISKDPDASNKKSGSYVPIWPYGNCNDELTNIKNLYLYVSTCELVSVKDKIDFMNSIVSSQDKYNNANADDYNNAREFLRILITSMSPNVLSDSIDKPGNAFYVSPFPSLNCQRTVTDKEYLVKNIYGYVNECSVILKKDSNTLINEVKSYITNSQYIPLINSDDYVKVYNYLVSLQKKENPSITTTYAEQILPETLPSLLCTKDTDNLTFCSNPYDIITQCSAVNADPLKGIENKKTEYKSKIVETCFKDLSKLNFDQYNKLKNEIYPELPVLPTKYLTNEQCLYDNDTLLKDPETAVKSCYLSLGNKSLVPNGKDGSDIMITLSNLIKSNPQNKNKILTNKDSYLNAIKFLKDNKTNKLVFYTPLDDVTIDRYLPSTLSDIDCEFPAGNKETEICSKPDSYLTSCSDSNKIYELTKCAILNQEYTDKDRYKKAQEIATSKGFNLPDISPVKCSQSSLSTTFYTDPYSFTQCPYIYDNNGTPLAGITLVNEMNDAVGNRLSNLNKDSYNKAKDYLLTKGISVPTIPDIDCSLINVASTNDCNQIDKYINSCIGLSYSKNGGIKTISETDAKQFLDSCNPLQTNFSYPGDINGLLPIYNIAKDKYQNIINKNCSFSNWSEFTECSNGTKQRTRTATPDNLGCGPLVDISSDGCPSPLTAFPKDQFGSGELGVVIILYDDYNFKGSATKLKLNDMINIDFDTRNNMFLSKYKSMRVEPGINIIFTSGGTRKTNPILLSNDIPNFDIWFSGFYLNNDGTRNTTYIGMTYNIKPVSFSTTFKSQNLAALSFSQTNYKGISQPLYKGQQYYIGYYINSLFLTINSIYTSKPLTFKIYSYDGMSEYVLPVSNYSVTISSTTDLSKLFPFGYSSLIPNNKLLLYTIELIDDSIIVIDTPVKLDTYKCSLDIFLTHNSESCKAVNPCSDKTYSINNMEKCKLEIDNKCKTDNTFNSQNLGFLGVCDTCDVSLKRKEIFTDDCRRQGFEPCKDVNFFSLHSDKCSNFDPCEITNIAQIPDLINQYKCTDKIINKCKDPLYFNDNPGCSDLGVTVLDTMTDDQIKTSCTNYDYNNNQLLKACRKKGYEPCNDPIYLTASQNTAKECKKIDDKYEACNDFNFLQNQLMYCKNTAGYEPCNNNKYLTFSTQNADFCRQIDPKYEACNDPLFLQNNSNYCNRKLNPCLDPSYMNNNIVQAFNNNTISTAECKDTFSQKCQEMINTGVETPFTSNCNNFFVIPKVDKDRSCSLLIQKYSNKPDLSLSAKKIYNDLNCSKTSMKQTYNTDGVNMLCTMLNKTKGTNPLESNIRLEFGCDDPLLQDKNSQLPSFPFNAPSWNTDLVYDIDCVSYTYGDSKIRSCEDGPDKDGLYYDEYPPIIYSPKTGNGKDCQSTKFFCNPSDCILSPPVFQPNSCSIDPTGKLRKKAIQRIQQPAQYGGKCPTEQERTVYGELCSIETLCLSNYTPKEPQTQSDCPDGFTFVKNFDYNGSSYVNSCVITDENNKLKCVRQSYGGYKYDNTTTQTLTDKLSETKTLVECPLNKDLPQSPSSQSDCPPGFTFMNDVSFDYSTLKLGTNCVKTKSDNTILCMSEKGLYGNGQSFTNKYYGGGPNVLTNMKNNSKMYSSMFSSSQRIRTTPKKHLKFSDYNSLMRTMSISI